MADPRGRAILDSNGKAHAQGKGTFLGAGDDAALAPAADTPGPYPAETQRAETRAQSPFARFYERTIAKLIADLRATYGAGPPDPEDVAQQAFLKLDQSGRFEALKSPENFVWITARNIVMSEKRALAVRQKNQVEVTDRVFHARCDDRDPERVFISKQQLGLVMAVLERMPARRRRIFLLNRVHGLTPAEIGRRLGLARTGIVRHIALATEEINKALAANQEKPGPQKPGPQALSTQPGAEGDRDE
ncbi:MAG: RNA polymerase sigma factor [Pseudomonadota bacterium]